MATEQNPYAKIAAGLKTTAAAASFIETVTYDAIPPEALRIGTRCLLDGLGLFVAVPDAFIDSTSQTIWRIRARQWTSTRGP